MIMITNMSQIHDEQRSIQMTMSHRHREKALLRQALIINNGRKNSKCRPKSNTQ